MELSLLVKGCMKFAFMKFGLLLLIATLGSGFRGMMYLWLKVNSICEDYTSLFGEMDDLRKEASNLVDTLQSLEHTEDIKLALIINTCEFDEVNGEKNKKAFQDFIKVHTCGSTEELSKDVKQVLNRVWKLRIDMASKGDELAELPPLIANMVFLVTLKSVLLSNVDDLCKGLSSLQEAQLSLIRKQDAVAVRSRNYAVS